MGRHHSFLHGPDDDRRRARIRGDSVAAHALREHTPGDEDAARDEPACNDVERDYARRVADPEVLCEPGEVVRVWFPGLDQLRDAKRCGQQGLRSCLCACSSNKGKGDAQKDAK